ncbi:MAG: flavohemoglobin expression-modulating QEGLA motif protein [Bacteroidetes bacterium]|nr:flavohemoglobin expression-modulating QEGLA motif protein [Bacteroidota bacterium]
MVKAKLDSITNQFIETICKRLEENKQVRRTLPVWGRVHIDRQLPFICIFRQIDESDDSLPERLVMSEASYLTASGNRKLHKQLSLLVSNIALTMKNVFGSFLIIEVWIKPENEITNDDLLYQPGFRIIRTKNSSINPTIEKLEKSLRSIKIRRQPSTVEVFTTNKIVPPGLNPILSSVEIKQLGCHMLGIEVSPIYKNLETHQIFPLVRRELQRKFSRSLKGGFFKFTNNKTTYRPPNFQSLGRWSMVKAVWEVDSQLAEISSGFDFLLQVTPINSNSAWNAFQKSKYRSSPEFYYRPLPIDPALSKRKLYQVPIERIEDPTLAQLFRQQQQEIDRKLTMLIDMGTPRFIFGSLQLYGIVEESLLNLSKQILEKLSPRSRDESSGNIIDANIFAARAMKELSYFRKTLPNSRSKIIIREDISGLMVSHGNLLIGKYLKISETRMEALIQHEVGTHVLTYLNGKAQPFKQLYVGLAGYDELQEGLAVLAEYLVGGFTSPRLRLLAARVIAAHNIVNGASFEEVFHELNRNYGFEQTTSFTITMRTFRSGGLTKDAVYLRGLVKLLEYLKSGGELEPLYMGKISADHVAIIKELNGEKFYHQFH